MDYRFFDPWDQVLPREPGHVVGVAGGAATEPLLAAIAAVYADAAVPHVRCEAGAADPGNALVALYRTDDPALPPTTAARAARWPARTSLAVVAVAVNGVGGRADAVFGPGQAPPGIEPWTVLTWELLEPEILAAVDRVPADVPVVLAWCGLADQPDSIGLFACTGRLMGRPRIEVVLFCSGGDGPTIRACCRADGD